MIYEREAVRLALAAEMVENPGDTEAATEKTAARLGVPVEVVMEVVADTSDGQGARHDG